MARLVVGVATAVDPADVNPWANEQDVPHKQFVLRFSREEPRGAKEHWTLTEEIGHAGPECPSGSRVRRGAVACTTVTAAGSDACVLPPTQDGAPPRNAP